MSPKLPALAAGPNEVRAYISRVLVSKHDTTSEFADEAASLWRLGRGSELRDASLQSFRKIFGDYNGWFLFRIVQEDKLEDWEQSSIGIISFYAIIGSTILAAFLLLRVVVLHVCGVPSRKGFKKVALPILQALLVMGLSILSYGLLTPSSEGVSIAVFGSVLFFPSGMALFVCLVPPPQEARQGPEKQALAGTG